MLYDATGNLFDTAAAGSVQGGMGRAIFVMDESGNIYASLNHEVGQFHHSSFLAGGDVAAAGELEVVNGVVRFVNNQSGHYHPAPESLEQFAMELESFYGIDRNSFEVEIINNN